MTSCGPTPPLAARHPHDAPHLRDRPFRSGSYCTPEHRLWLRAPQRRWNNTIHHYRRHLDAPEWVEAKDAHNLFAASPSPSPTKVSPSRHAHVVADRPLRRGRYVNKQVNVYIARARSRTPTTSPAGLTTSRRRSLLTMPSQQRTGLAYRALRQARHGKTIPRSSSPRPRRIAARFLDGYCPVTAEARGPQVHGVHLRVRLPYHGIELLAKSLGYTCTVSQYQVAPTTVIEGAPSTSVSGGWSVPRLTMDGSPRPTPTGTGSSCAALPRPVRSPPSTTSPSNATTHSLLPGSSSTTVRTCPWPDGGQE